MKSKRPANRQIISLKTMKPHSLLKKIDQFGEPLPVFNLNGEKKVHTITGGVVSVAITMIILCYGVLKFIHLITKHNSNVASVLETGVFDFNDVTNLNEVGFRFAFSVRDFRSKELKDDPRYVKYLVRMYGRKEGKEFERILPYHKCEESDWDKFPPASNAHSDSF